jgi:hypothetical protein
MDELHLEARLMEEGITMALKHNSMNFKLQRTFPLALLAISTCILVRQPKENYGDQSG